MDNHPVPLPYQAFLRGKRVWKRVVHKPGLELGLRPLRNLVPMDLRKTQTKTGRTERGGIGASGSPSLIDMPAHRLGLYTFDTHCTDVKQCFSVGNAHPHLSVEMSMKTTLPF